MRSYKFVYLLPLILISLILSCNKAPKSDSEQETPKESIVDLYLYENISESVINDNILVNDSIIKQKLNGGSGIKKPILIWRFSSYSCGTCVEYGKNKIEEHLAADDVLYIVSEYKDIPWTNAKNVVNLGNQSLNIPFEKTNIPFFAIYDNGIIKHFFIPDKTLSEYTDLYLRMLKKRYFNN